MKHQSRLCVLNYSHFRNTCWRQQFVQSVTFRSAIRRPLRRNRSVHLQPELCVYRRCAQKWETGEVNLFRFSMNHLHYSYSNKNYDAASRTSRRRRTRCESPKCATQSSYWFGVFNCFQKFIKLVMESFTFWPRFPQKKSRKISLFSMF